MKIKLYGREGQYWTNEVCKSLIKKGIPFYFFQASLHKEIKFVPTICVVASSKVSGDFFFRLEGVKEIREWIKTN
jgi:hypothetical protein